MKITKAVFPVAGMGTRFLPATKASPKEMMPIVDKPLIQYAVEEAVAAGLTEMIFITGRHKRAIEDHFDKAYEIETELASRGKRDLLELVQGILPSNVNCIYIRQPEQLGLGHAVLCARPVINDEPFAVILADDLIDGSPPVMRQMAEVFAREGRSVLGVQEVARGETGSYGVVKSSRIDERLESVEAIVEKPRPEVAPSNLAVIGRYVLTPAIFGHLERATAGAGGEIQLTDGIAALLEDEPVFVLPFTGIRYDCGSKIGYLRATVEYGLRHPDLGESFRAYLQNVWER
jgi:UTP--glucose-1-phosphate uridylyltransferase